MLQKKLVKRKKKSHTIICSKRMFLNKFIWTQGRLFQKHAKKRQKLKLCWMFEKIFLSEKNFGNTCLPSKSPSGSVESLSDNPPDHFPPKLRFLHKFLKKTLPPRPLSEKKYQCEHFSRKIFFLEKLIWTDKDTILTICFQSSKNICRVSRRSEKILKTLIQPKKGPFT